MNILVLRSSFQTDDFVNKEYAELFKMLQTTCQAEITILGDNTRAVNKWIKTGVNPDFIMTATGGVENLFEKIFFAIVNDSIDIIADGRNNSLAAALEILSYLDMNSFKGTIIHGTNEEIVNAVKSKSKPFSDVTIGCFGPPSDWLISSDIDRNYVHVNFGFHFVDIDLQDLSKGIQDADVEDAKVIADTYTKRAKALVEPNETDMIEAAKVYLAIKEICKKRHLNAITIRCFDIIKSCSTTSCLALAMLNDEGIVAGCEGDMQTLITMIMAKKVTGEKAFMANPSILTDHSSLLAHCTLPLSMCDEIIMRSHFESGIGVAIQGLLPTTDYTLLKWGGEYLSKFFVAEGKALPIDYSNHFCRTQIKLDIDLRPYLLNKTIGNHQVIIKGHHSQEIIDFMRQNNIEQIG